MKTRVVFLGTPEFACPTLDTILADDDTYEVMAVVTQPDRPAGRSLETQVCRVKQMAEQYLGNKTRANRRLEVLTPVKASDPEFVAKIAAMSPDVAVVVAYGQILSPAFLNIFPKGAVNVHASLLPRWRGAAPIAWALLKEDPVTGVTLQKIVKELDAGDIIATAQVVLDETWDGPKLYSELSRRGADLVRKYLPDYVAGKIKLIPQEVAQVTLAPKIKKEMGLVDWAQHAREICARIRAFTPWPGVYTTRNGRTLKILRAKAIEYQSNLAPGSLVSVDKISFVVQCGGATALLVTVVQPESRARQPASEYLKGYPFIKGDSLGG